MIRPPGDPRPSIGALLSDPAVRSPLKTVLRSWAARDPLDAAEDAGLLALALERRADERCGAGVQGGPFLVREASNDRQSD